MFYTIYKTTNLATGKVYIGKHVTKDPNDAYLGSGKYLLRAIRKYGVSNFKKEVLFVFLTEAEMNAKEAELVSQSFVREDTNYNLCPGGQGGFGYLNETYWTPDRVKARTEYHKRVLKGNAGCARGGSIVGQQHAKKWKEHPETKPVVFTPEFNAEMAVRAQAEDVRGRRMKTYQETNFQQGQNNSQYGTMWITNGTENRKIKKDADVPEGWYKGYRPKRKTTAA